MIQLSRFVHSETGKYIMSLLLGLGLATLFRKACKGKNCVVYSAPPIEELEETYKFDDKCYKLEKNSTKCDKKRQIFTFEGY